MLPLKVSSTWFREQYEEVQFIKHKTKDGMRNFPIIFNNGIAKSFISEKRKFQINMYEKLYNGR